MNEPGFSYGAAYADLNNNGSLDLVINNINSPADVYQNMAPVDDSSHYLMVRLEGTPPNTGGIGARVVVWSGGQQQHIYQNPYRGFMSSVDSPPALWTGRILPGRLPADYLARRAIPVAHRHPGPIR
jgi:enediyne biosynthesis protein E4